MNDYISRVMAIARLTKVEVTNKLATMTDAKRVIAEMPAADVVPVVRCRDCKKSGLTEFGKRYCSEPMGAFYGCIPVEDDFFCSGGKR